MDRSGELARIRRGAAEGWQQLKEALGDKSRNNLVRVDWGVDYDELGHDTVIHAEVTVAVPEDVLLQVWLQDLHPGIWIPELRPWVASVVEFTPRQAVKQVKLALADSKWRPEDQNETYQALLWGYLDHAGAVEHFSFERNFVYPG